MKVVVYQALIAILAAMLLPVLAKIKEKTTIDVGSADSGWTVFYLAKAITIFASSWPGRILMRSCWPCRTIGIAGRGGSGPAQEGNLRRETPGPNHRRTTGHREGRKPLHVMLVECATTKPPLRRDRIPTVKSLVWRFCRSDGSLTSVPAFGQAGLA